MRRWALVLSALCFGSCLIISAWGMLRSGIGSMAADASEGNRNLTLAMLIGWPFLALAIIFLIVALKGRR